MKGLVFASLLIVLLLTGALPASAQNPNLPSVTSVSLDKSMLVGGGYVPTDRCVGTVTISQPHTANLNVLIDTYQANAVKFSGPDPPTGYTYTNVTIPAGSTSGNFNVYGRHISASVNAQIRAAYNATEQFTNITVEPIHVASITIPGNMLENTTGTGTVTLNYAKATNLNVLVDTNNNSAAGPNSTSSPPSWRNVQILAGQTSANFTVYARNVTQRSSAQFSAAYNGSIQYAGVTVDITAREEKPGDENGPKDSQECTDTLIGYINTATGNVHWIKIDPVATRGYPLTCNVHVNSQVSDTSRPMGNASFSYDIFVTTRQVYSAPGVSQPHWFVVDGDGTRLDFGVTSAAPSASPGIFSTLLQVPGGYRLENAGPPESLRYAGNFTYHFDSTGRLVQIVDPTGNPQNLAYSSGQLSSVTDVNTGKQITYAWTNGLVSSFTQGAGGAVTNLTYTSSRLTGISIGNAQWGTLNSVAFAYNPNGSIASVTRDGNPSNATTYSYTLYASKSGGPGIPMANAGGATRPTNLVWGLTPGTGAVERISDTTAKAGTTLYDLNALGDVVRIIDPIPIGATQAPTRTITYNGNRLPLTISDGTNTIQLTHAANGMTTGFTNELSKSWQWNFTGVDLTSTLDPLGRTESVAYGNPAQPHVPTSFTDKDSGIWSFGHNIFGQMTQSTPPVGSPSGPVSTTYDETPGSSTLGYAKTVTDSNGDLVTFDAYSLLGDLAQVSTYPITGNTAVKNTSVLTWDAAQRLRAITHPDNKTAQWIYTGRHLTRTIDEAGTPYDFQYCACGKPIGVTGPLGWSLGWGLDGDREITSFTDARSKTTLYGLGAASELTQITFPDNSILSFLYDNHGRVRQATNGRNQQAVFGYDAAHRPTTVTYPTTGMTGFTFGYFDDNRLQQVTDGAGTAAFTYTPGGQVASVTYNYGASGLVPVQRLDYLYNPDGSRASMTWTNGGVVVGTWLYQYDAGGRLIGVTNPWAESTGWGYDGEGKLKHQQNANGTRTEWGYFEARGWPSSITHKLNGTPFASYALSYDNGLNTVGLLTGVLELDGSTVGFGYDALYRLTSDARTGLNPFSHTYQYDLAGNPVTVNGQAFATFDDANKIATIAGGSATHDGDGNLTSISGTNVPAGTFTWDDLSRMTGYTAGGIPRNYGYDASGTRIWSQTGTNPKKIYIFDGDLLLGEIDSASNTVTAANTWGANGLISQRLTSGSFWFHFGPQGESRQLTNAAGAVTDSYLYAPYGAPTATAGTTPNPFRYGGQFGYYSEADLYLCGARWYHPFLARWLSRDPIGYSGGPNLYEYCLSNPLRFTDAEGTEVRMVFDRQKGTVTVTELDGQKRQMHFTGVFSGDGQHVNKPASEGVVGSGPIPSGTYLVDTQTWGDGMNWRFKAYGKFGDKWQYDPSWKKGNTTRGQFNVHAGRTSLGCVTFRSDVDSDDSRYPFSKEFEKLRKLLTSTSTRRYAGPGKGNFVGKQIVR